MWCNTQVTYSPNFNAARSESELETDPRNPFIVVGSSKRFTNISTYDFTLACYASADGGESWIEAPPLTLLTNPDPNKTWAGISDPVVAFDDAGGCYLVALPFPGHTSPFIYTRHRGVQIDRRRSDVGRAELYPSEHHRR
jgi:hypothetical protein